jgi:hypothetical protein
VSPGGYAQIGAGNILVWDFADTIKNKHDACILHENYRGGL